MELPEVKPNATSPPRSETLPNRFPKIPPSQVNLLELQAELGGSYDWNVDFYDHYFTPLKKQGKLLFHREIRSPIDRRVRVWDEKLKQEREMIMMGSNSYLGLANDPIVKERIRKALDQYGVGMGGPMLLNGTSGLHREVELQIARLKGKEDAILLPSGYMANLAWINTLVTDEAILLYDEMSHASVADGIRLGRKRAFRFQHNDVMDLEEKLARFRTSGRRAKRDIFVTVQGVYSMNGELAPIPELVEVCEKYNAYLVIDDAHGTGVMGGGRGTADHFGLESRLRIAMGTLSKAFSVTGGFIASDRKTINYLRYLARPYFFSASLSPMVMTVILTGLEMIEKDPSRVARIHHNANGMRKRLAQSKIRFMDTEGAIIPIFPHNPEYFRDLSEGLHREGLFVNPIEPPGVPKGTERFRLTVMSTHTESDLDEAVQILKSVYDRYRQ